MAVFDSFKNLIEKAIQKIQPGDEKILEEQSQEQVNIETPREELSEDETSTTRIYSPETTFS